MSQGMSLHANYAGIDQGSADMNVHGANWGEVGERASSIVRKVSEEMGYGDGTREHEAALAKVQELVEEHKNGIHLQQTGTQNAGDSFVSYGKRMLNRMRTSQV